MNGFEIMLKSMGFDTAQIEGKFQEARAVLEQTFAHFNARLDKQDAQLSRIEEQLAKLLGTVEQAKAQPLLLEEQPRNGRPKQLPTG